MISLYFAGDARLLCYLGGMIILTIDGGGICGERSDKREL